MIAAIIVASIHFVLGAAGVWYHNRRLDRANRIKSWIKYVWYLGIFIAVSASALLSRFAFMLISIAVIAAIVIEIIAGLNKATERGISFPPRFLILLFSLMSLVVSFYSLLIFLPARIIFYIYLIVVIFDGASQITGQLTGRHYILPLIIPGKTWEGFLGGLTSATLTAVILHNLVSVSLLIGLAAGVVISLSSFSGDMAASYVKRRFGIKDFGDFLPGQGGFADRFDSFIISGAITGLLMLVFSCRSFQPESELINYILYSAGLLLIVFTGELFFSFFRLKAEYTRIFNHFAAGTASLLMLRAFHTVLPVTALCLQSSLFLLIAGRAGIFRSLKGVRRVSYGDSLFFIGVMVSYLFSVYFHEQSLFYIPVIIMTVSDPMAALTGMSIGSGRWPTLNGKGKTDKSFAGSTAFFISAALVIVVALYLFAGFTPDKTISVALICSAVTTFAEAYSSYGLDNITVPAVNILMLILTMYL